MRKFHLLFVPLISIGLSVFIFSCNESTVGNDSYGSIRGTVKASEDGLPLVGVNITTRPGTTAVSTDENGEFNFGDILIGEYSVLAKKEDYTSENLSVKVQRGQEVVMVVIMQIAPVESDVPDEPIYVSPLNIEDDQPVSVELVWNNGETIDGDTLRYDVILYEGGDDFVGSKVASNILDTTLVVSGLLFETSYRWKVIARNRSLDESEGREWKFRTEDFPNNRFFFVKDTLGSKDIYSWDLTEGHLVRLTTDGNSQIQPRLSPNRQLLAYTSHETSNYHIYTMDKKGENVVRITRDRPVVGYHNNGMGFCWSPDGDEIVFSHYDELWRIKHDGTGEKRIAITTSRSRHFRGCDWNKYTDKIVYLTIGVEPYDSEIYIMNSDGSDKVVLVDNVPGVLSGPKFSIDGSQVIFSQDVNGLEYDDGRQLDAHIFRIDVDGSNLTDLSADNKAAGTNDLQAIYSPDGGKIIFMNTTTDGYELKNIWTMDVDGGGREQIISNAEMPEWN